ncbi:hypothetical protein [Janibacter limosus]|jgi:hypothetical protein|uniref:hypothetical protein n=1 Tax=Janibacter limosus TaxID=53458 RepID=UPI00082A603F|nr:hypothetical protein [Janibacter limosus]
MGLDYRFTYLLTQVGWALPTTIAVLVIAAIALVRRDEGLWWKLVVGGALALLLGHVVSILGNALIVQMSYGHQLYWLISVPSLILNVAGISLLGAGAITGRRGQVATR